MNNQWFQNIQQMLSGYAGEQVTDLPPEEPMGIVNEEKFVTGREQEDFYNKNLSGIHKMYAEVKDKTLKKILEDCIGVGSPMSALKEVLGSSSKLNGVCGKVLTVNDSGWKCLDCELDPTCIICTECFEKGNHKGHRIFFKSRVSGMCDCGDLEAWRPGGNCSDHQGQTTGAGDIPASFSEKFNKGFLCTMYYLFYYLERPKNKTIYRRYLTDFILEIFQNLQNLIRIYPQIGYVLSECLIMPANYAANESPELSNKFTMWHDCKNLKDHPKEGDLDPNLPEKPSCTCSVLDLFFRNSLYFSDKKDVAIGEIFQSMFAYFSLKKEMAIAYMKYPWLMRDHTRGLFTKIDDLSIQILTSEELAYLALKSEYFPSFLKSIKMSIRTFIAHNPQNYWSKIWRPIQTMKYLFMKPSAVKQLTQDRNLVRAFLKTFSPFHAERERFWYSKTANNIDFMIVNLELQVRIQDFVINLVKDLTVMVNSLDHAERKIAYNNFFNELRSIITANKTLWMADDCAPQKFHYFTLIYERVFAIFIGGYICLEKGSDNKLMFRNPSKVAA
jgi:hypothetical protein